MHVINPVNINTSYLNVSNAVESTAAWVSGAAYLDGALVSYDSSTAHGIYVRLGDGTGTTSPEVDTEHWTRVGPNNKWAMFDMESSTRTKAPNNLAVTFSGFDGVWGLGLFGLVGASVTVSAQTSGGALYAQVVRPINGTARNPDQVVLGSLTVPAGGTLSILISNPGGQAECGACAIGPEIYLGVTQPGASIGIVSFSKKETDEFGVTTLKKRANSKRLSVQILVNNASLDAIYRTLSELDGMPCVWVSSGLSILKPLDVFGFSKDFSITVTYAAESLCSLEVESLA